MTENISSLNQKDLIKVIDYINNNLQNYVITISEKMFPVMVFDSDYAFNPDTIKDVIKSIIEAFLSYLKTNDIQLVSKLARDSINSGLNDRIIISIYRIFNSLIIEEILKTNSNQYINFINHLLLFLADFINDFWAARSVQIHQEQKQLYKTLTNTITKEREKLLQTEKELQEAKVKALEEANIEKTTFLINLSHEIKLPLTIIQNAVVTVTEEAGRRKLPTLPLLYTEVLDLKQLIFDILDYEKILQGKMLYPHNKVINISNIVRAKLESFQPSFEQNKITLTTHIGDTLYSRIDDRAMDRILNNIIDNAVKYNKDNGTIHVNLSEKDGFIILEISDTGYGIPPEQLPHILKPYYQSSTKKKNIQGIGAGLSLVYQILTEVDGKINIESVEGEETTITILLKKKEIEETDKITEHPVVTNPVKRKNIKLKQAVFDENKKTIFVVEDNIKLVKFLEKELFDEYNFYYALHGRDALRKLETIAPPDLIISDIMMDVMDGYEFFKQLKESTEFRDVPLIFLSAKTSVEDQVMGLDLGAAVYITKPFDVRVLKAAIKALIRDHESYSRRELETLESRILSALHTKKKNKSLLDKRMAGFNVSPREKDVLVHVLKGLTNNEIAEILFIDIETVSKHIQSIKRRCGVNRKIQLLNIFKE